MFIGIFQCLIRETDYESMDEGYLAIKFNSYSSEREKSHSEQFAAAYREGFLSCFDMLCVLVSDVYMKT